MLRRHLVPLAIATLIAGCGTHEPATSTAAEPELTAAQESEVLAWANEAREASAHAAPFGPSSDWHEIAHNVWRQQTFDGEGHLVGERVHTEGIGAMEWAVVNLWLPRAEEIRSELEGGIASREQEALLKLELRSLQARVADLERWRDLEATR